MALYKSDPFPGTDYNNYLNWQKVTLPSGETYYVVPGHPGYVFDPVASNASGRKVFHSNPQQQIQDQADQKAQQDKLQKQQEFNQSPAGQLLPVGAGIAGLYAANKFGAFDNGSTALANALTKGTTAGSSTLANAATTGATSGGVATPELVGASKVVPEAGIGYAPYLGVAGAGLGAYELYNGIKSGSTGQSALGGAGLGAGLAAAAPLVGLGPVGWGGLALAAALGAGGGAGLSKLFGHETTRDLAKKHTGQLQGQAPDDTQWQNYVQGMRAQYDSAPPDPSKPYHGGQYGSWDEYKTAGLDAGDLTGVYGNLKVYGPKWSKLTLDQQKAVTQANINDGLYDSKKGEVIINDENKALQNFDNVITGNVQPKQTQQQPAAVVPVPVVPKPGVAVQLQPSTQPIVAPLPGANIDPGFTLGAAAAQGATKPIVRPLPRSPLDRFGRGS
jgi:hypothetical protein